MLDTTIRHEVLDYMRRERKEWMANPESQGTVREFNLAIDSLEKGGVAKTLALLTSTLSTNLEMLEEEQQREASEDPDLKEISEVIKKKLIAENSAIERWLAELRKENN